MIEKYFVLLLAFILLFFFFFNFIPFIFYSFIPSYIVSYCKCIAFNWESFLYHIYKVIIHVWIKYEIWEDKTKEIYILLGLIENCDIGLKGSDFSNKKIIVKGYRIKFVHSKFLITFYLEIRFEYLWYIQTLFFLQTRFSIKKVLFHISFLNLSSLVPPKLQTIYKYYKNNIINNKKLCKFETIKKQINHLQFFFYFYQATSFKIN